MKNRKNHSIDQNTWPEPNSASITCTSTGWLVGAEVIADHDGHGDRELAQPSFQAAARRASGRGTERWSSGRSPGAYAARRGAPSIRGCEVDRGSTVRHRCGPRTSASSRFRTRAACPPLSLRLLDLGCHRVDLGNRLVAGAQHVDLAPELGELVRHRRSLAVGDQRPDGRLAVLQRIGDLVALRAVDPEPLVVERAQRATGEGAGDQRRRRERGEHDADARALAPATPAQLVRLDLALRHRGRAPRSR